MRSFKADYVFTVLADPIKNGVVTIDDSGEVIGVSTTADAPANIPVENLGGVICPGFVNTHCHLELSHLRGKIDRETGLSGFIQNVQKTRTGDDAGALDAAYRADDEMYQNGIVAVGDISNTPLSLAVKDASKLYYHTFVESFSFQPTQAEAAFQKAKELLSQFKPRPA